MYYVEKNKIAWNRSGNHYHLQFMLGIPLKVFSSQKHLKQSCNLMISPISALCFLPWNNTGRQSRVTRRVAICSFFPVNHLTVLSASGLLKYVLTAVILRPHTSRLSFRWRADNSTALFALKLGLATSRLDGGSAIKSQRYINVCRALRSKRNQSTTVLFSSFRLQWYLRAVIHFVFLLGNWKYSK